MNKASTAELKSSARAVLLGKWGFMAYVFLAEIMLNMIFEEIIGMAFPSSGFGIAADGSIVFSIPWAVCQIIIRLFSTILSVGSMFLYLNICRGRTFQFKDLFFGFTHRPEHISGYFAVIAAATIFCSAVPSVLLVLALRSGNALWGIGLLAAVPLCIAGYFRLTLGYAMFPYLYADSPWKTSRELLRESQRMMNGSKLRYFRLQLSFLGILLLGFLSFGIGMIWISPYMTTTSTQFYLNLISAEEEKQEYSESSAYESEDSQDEPFN